MVLMNIQPATHNAHMAETMYLHYDERIHHHATPQHIKPMLLRHQLYWQDMYLRATAETTPLKDIIQRFFS